MKKIFYYFFIVFSFFFFTTNVFAKNYSTNELIPIDSVATVDTDLFSYNDIQFSYNENGVSLVNFSSIQNKTEKKVPVSINLLMFDSSKKNIGFISYCSEKDVSSDYSQFMLAGKSNTSFSINVSSKYFVENFSSKDVKYIAVYDENGYCHVGGYDKYAGLSIDKISDGHVANENSEKVLSLEVMSFVKNNLLKIILLIFFVISFVIVIEGIFINMLHKKMYNEGTFLAFLPIANFYVCVKLSFGSMIAKYYIIAFLASILLSIFGVTFLSSILFFVNLASFIIVIFKLITKKYDLFLDGVSNSTKKTEFFVNSSSSTSSSNTNIVKENNDKSVINVENSNSSNNDNLSNLFPTNNTELSIISQSDVDSGSLNSNNNVVSQDTTQSILSDNSGLNIQDDISLDNADNRSKELMNSLFDSNSSSITSDSSNDNVNSVFDSSVQNQSLSNNNIDNNGNINNNSNNNNDGESDLAKFFK